MTSNLTDTLKNRILDWMNGVGSPTRPTTPLKVILYTVMPNQQTGLGGTAVSGFAYADTTVVFTSGTTGASSNVSDVTFPTATGGNWGTVVGIGIRDSAGSPLLLWTGVFPTPRDINNGQQYVIPSGAITQVF